MKHAGNVLMKKRKSVLNLVTDLSKLEYHGISFQ